MTRYRCCGCNHEGNANEFPPIPCGECSGGGPRCPNCGSSNVAPVQHRGESTSEVTPPSNIITESSHRGSQ